MEDQAPSTQRLVPGETPRVVRSQTTGTVASLSLCLPCLPVFGNGWIEISRPPGVLTKWLVL